YFSEIGGIEAMATNKLLERNDYGEDAYEDLKKRQLEYAIKKEDSLLQKGRQEGEAIGIQKGEAIGIQKGEAIGIQKGEAIGKIKTMLELKVDYLQIRKLLDKPGFTKEIFLEALISADRDGIKLPKPALEQLKYSGIKTINQGRDINNNNRVR
ncbi:MAG: hypothetical protein FWF57_07080, partial [Defluviitaleaceae bacterium]|nr:hypothetical protein [Defluviitaleaceae bacterium]